MKNINKALAVHPEFQLYQRNNTAYCSSLQVAEAFEKQHKNVLRDIEALGQLKSKPSTEIGQLTSGESSETDSESHSMRIEKIKNFFKKNFIRTTYINSQNKKQPMYLMTRTGFTVLVNGYSGEKAMYFKILYEEY